MAVLAELHGPAGVITPVVLTIITLGAIWVVSAVRAARRRTYDSSLAPEGKAAGLLLLALFVPFFYPVFPVGHWLGGGRRQRRSAQADQDR